MDTIPKTITTTEIQRSPKILEELNKGEEPSLIIKDSKPVGVYSPLKTYNKMINKLKKLQREKEMEDFKEALEDVKAGRFMDADEFFNSIKD